MLNRKTISVTLVALVSIAGTFLYTMWQGNGPARIANRQAQVAKDLVKVTEPMTSSLRNFNPVAPSQIRSRREVPAPVQVSLPRSVDEPAKAAATRSLTIFAAEERPLREAAAEADLIVVGEVIESHPLERRAAWFTRFITR